jgi:hypothetical protein
MIFKTMIMIYLLISLSKAGSIKSQYSNELYTKQNFHQKPINLIKRLKIILK